jgi:hypothetical protein
MQHPDEGTIHSWLDGALSADEAARVEAHVKDCPECAVAVAEARGFIAAASRILTALDNAPRGVIPAAAPKKSIDPIVWRVAATLLVVAGGTFAVLRSNGGKSAPGFTTYETPDSAPVPQFAPPITIMGNPARPASGSSQATLSGKQPPAKVEASDSPTARKNGRAVAGGNAQNVFSGKELAKMGAADMSTATRNAPTPAGPPVTLSATPPESRPQVNTGAALSGNVAGRSGTIVEAPTLRALTPAAAGSVASLDSASESRALKIVGRPRQIGARITLYEVAPGDTVTLTEIMSLQLDAVVVTGMSTARTADQSTEKSVTTQAAKGAVAPAVTASDSQGAAAGAPSPTPAQARRAQTGNVLTSKTGNVEVSNGVTTISWADPVTRNVMKLSGRMSAARLQQVKSQIERERAAEAAKKKP